MSVEKLAALKACKDTADRIAFFANDQPKCPHCGDECDVSENDWWHLYEEGEHDVTCPNCEHDFTVYTRVSYTFSTEHQDDTP